MRLVCACVCVCVCVCVCAVADPGGPRGVQGGVDPPQTDKVGLNTPKPPSGYGAKHVLLFCKYDSWHYEWCRELLASAAYRDVLYMTFPALIVAVGHRQATVQVKLCQNQSQGFQN